MTQQPFRQNLNLDFETIVYPHPRIDNAPVVAIIYNPQAGSGPIKRKLDWQRLTTSFFEADYSVLCIPTRCSGDGETAAQFALAQQVDLIAPMGGDGTINEVIQSVVGTPTPILLLPNGTINVLAREMNVPISPYDAADMLKSSQVKAIDVGIANGRYFTMMIGLGYDGEIARTMTPTIKAVTGPFAYVISTIQSLVTHKTTRGKLKWVDAAGKKHRARRLIFLMVVANAHLYAGGFLKFTPQASLNDGLLDVCLVRSKRWYQIIYLGLLSVVGRLIGEEEVDSFQVQEIEIKTARKIPYQLDGDPAGVTPVHITVKREALNIMVPNNF
jgi:diacylglycerol kinase (ATP)